MKKSKLYTGSGDSGTTSLADGYRVPKTHQQVETVGTIDELNSFIGLLITETEDSNIGGILEFVQHTLFYVDTCLTTEPESTKLIRSDRITPSMIKQIEQDIDLLDSKLPEVKGFILPGGCHSAALAHVCRTVCRRAERQLCRLKEDVLIDDSVLVFLNRLSDLLFVIARHECFLKNVDEIIWNNTCK